MTALSLMACGGQAPREPSPQVSESGGAVAAGQACAWDVGTAHRVKQVLPPGTGATRWDGPSNMVAFQGQLYFSLVRQNGPPSLWRSDGTEPGTFAVKEFPLPPAGSLAQLTPTADQLFFVAAEPSHGSELWVSDGTAAGTYLFADLTPGVEGSSLNLLAGLGPRLVFIRSQAGGSQLWTAQATSSEVGPLVDLGTSVEEYPAGPVQLGDSVLFFFRSARGNTLWRTDGTAGGTVALGLLDRGPESARVKDVRVSEGVAFFTLLEPDGATEIWRTDGTPAGTLRLHTLGGEHRVSWLLGRIGASLYVAGTDLRNQRMSLFQLSAEVPGGREPLMTLPNPDADQPDALPYFIGVTASGGRLFFLTGISSPRPSPRTTQLWVTDGTQAGTSLLLEPVSNSDESVPFVQSVADNLVMLLVYSGGPSAWVTDGTVPGTRPVAYVGADGRPSDPGPYTRVGEELFFSARDGSGYYQLWSVPLVSACTRQEP